MTAGHEAGTNGAVSTEAVEALRSAPTVRRWFESAGYDSDPVDEQVRRLGLLAGFCERMEQEPGELVASCLRTTKAGETAISSKGRTKMNEEIAEFVESTGLEGREAVAAGNVIRGFLIHNGVFIQGPAWRG